MKTENIEDLPKALRALANIVETDIKRMGSSSNSIGIFGEIDGVVGDFDYEVNGTRVVCNPRGYQRHSGNPENMDFNSSLIVEI